MNSIDVNELRIVLEYNPNSGMFIRKAKGSGRLHCGDIAGYLRKDGYRVIMINGKRYLASRLAFAYINGREPYEDIDHINGMRDDNRIDNLREVSRRENNQNRKTHRKGKLCGTHLLKDTYRKKPWQSLVRVDGKVKLIGYYSTEQEAHNAYVSYLQKIECPIVECKVL